ncbi:MAG: zinc dependent phospholipase C family protein [Anaeroplasma sp.]
MKRFVLFFIICLFSIQNLFAFDYLTHEQISISVTKFFNIFKNENLYGSFINGSNAPDFIYRHSLMTLYYSHFYNPEDPRAENNALTKMCNFYDIALQYYREGKHTKAMFNLGCAAHYIQDMCCMVHQMNWSANIPNIFVIDRNSSNPYHIEIINAHADYEKAVNCAVMDKITPLPASEKLRKDLDGKYLDGEEVVSTDPKSFAMYYANELYKNKQFNKNTKYSRSDIEDIEVFCAYKATYFLVRAFLNFFRMI